MLKINSYCFLEEVSGVRTKILIADDETDIVSMLRAFFESKGYFVLSAVNGNAALKQVEQEPDIILLDINMSGLDGLKVCERIRDYVSCPILFLTARIEDTDKVKGFAVGGDDYIVKPFSLMELEARVTAHLRREARHNFEAQIKFSGDLTIDYSERCLFFEGKRLGRLLCNLQNPTSGKIFLNGKDIVGLGEEYRDLLGYLPQHFGYYPDFTALDFLLYVAALKGLSEKTARKKSKELLEAVGLFDESTHKIKTFSGGMKQRLGIAQAMLNDPRILILDEPTAGLDPKERIRFRNLISVFSKERIVILSTHIVSDVEFIAEEIIMMKSGQIVHFGKPQEITAEINGQVWECIVPSAQAEEYAATFNTSNLRNMENNKTVLRIISDHPPMADALRVQPNLEDLYLFYFKGDTEK